MIITSILSQGLDIHADASISYLQALLGGSVEVSE